MRDFSVFVMGIAAFTADMRRAIAIDAPLPKSISVTDDTGKTSDVTVPAHFAYLRVPVDHIDKPSSDELSIRQKWDVTPAPGAFPLDSAGDLISRDTFVQFLRFHEVILPNSPTPPDTDHTPLNNQGFPKAADAKSALWLPPMSALGTQKNKVDKQHLVADPKAVAAYVRFPNGKVSTAVASNFRFIGVKTSDGSHSGSLNRAVSQLMVCTMQVPDDPFTVECRDYGTDDNSKKITINFKGNVPNPWMVFACTSLEDTLQLPSVEDKFGTDFHFSLVYGLAEGPVTTADIALPKSVLPVPGAPQPLGASRCVPPFFDGTDAVGA